MRTMNWDSGEFKDLDVDAMLEQLTASAAALAVEVDDGTVPETLDEIEDGPRFRIPMLIPEEVESGDGRQMAKDALTTRDLPISLLWQPQTGDGHNGSFIVGRIDTIERLEGGLGNAEGVFDTGPYGREAHRLVKNKMLRGVSADLDEFEATVNGETLAEDMDPSTIKNEKMLVSKARVMAATLVAKPAFQECTIELVSDESTEQEFDMTDGIYEEAPTDDDAVAMAHSVLTASAAPVNPPEAWFANPELNNMTPLTVDDDGRVYGHIATWEMSHIGYNSSIKPPRSRSQYAYFRTGLVRTAEGSDVAVGQLTLAGGHAPLDADARLAVKHYDDTASAVADVSCGEDAFGIWVAGGLRPGVLPEQVRTLRASAPSGDWRPVNGSLELVAVCQVNVPGFPVARACVASGKVMSLVAAGASTLQKLRENPVNELTARIDRLERDRLEQKRVELSMKLAPERQARIDRLTAAAAAARATISPELERRAQAAAQLANDAEAVRKRFQELALDFKPDFKETAHPRDDEGKFRRVLGKLNEILQLESDFHGPDADQAKQALERAADAEDAGDTEGAKVAAEEAKAKIDVAADAAPETSDAPAVPGTEPAGPGVGAKLKEVSADIATAVADAARGDSPADAPLEDIPAPIKDLIDALIDELGEGVDPMTVVSRLDGQAKHWLEGKGFQSPEQMAKVIAKMMERPLQPGITQ